VKGTIPIARAYHACVTVSDSKIVLFGGRDGLRRMNDTYVLDVTAMTRRYAVCVCVCVMCVCVCVCIVCGVCVCT